MRGMLGHLSAGMQFLFLLLLCVFSLSVFALLAAAGMKYIFNAGDVFDFAALEHIHDARVVWGIKFSQFLNSIGLFIVPPLLFAYLVSPHSGVYLLLNKHTKPLTWVFTALAMLCSIPFLNYMIEWNEGLSLPESMQEIEKLMREMEERSREISGLLLNMPRFSDYLFALFLIAFIPAIGEELLFRGVIQKLLTNIIRNAHTAIFLTAILFSFLHFQFFGFFPRTFFGLLFGYMLLWSGSLRLPIFAHFINNALVVTAHYIGVDTTFSRYLDALGKGESGLVMAAGSFVLLTICMVCLYRFTRNKNA